MDEDAGAPVVVVEGCPVADGKAGCVIFCAGGWDGTRITTKAMTRAVNNETIKPIKLGCQPLQDRAEEGLRLVRARREQEMI